jgi:hypothetical protein
MDGQERNVSQHENVVAQSLLEKSDAGISASGNVVSPVSQSGSLKSERSRREYRWSKVAREFVRANLAASGKELSNLLTRLEEESGNPRWACRRFVRRMGIEAKRPQRSWTIQEQQRLMKLLDLHPVKEIAQLMRRSESSIWHMLKRLGANAKMGKDSFTKYTLGVALHVRPEKVEEWIGRGWLEAREVETGSGKRVIIDAEQFCDFCRKHTRDVVGNRLSKERLDFVYHFAFPPSHAELLPVRESKKERDAYEQQIEAQNLGEAA